MSPIHPQYIIRDPSEPQTPNVSSYQVLRTSTNTPFLATTIPKTICTSTTKGVPSTKLSSAILPVASVSLSRILNHPNIISLVDIVHTDSVDAKETANLAIYEDMNAGSLAYLLPPMSIFPDPYNQALWSQLIHPSLHRQSLPESLCWHVLRSISRSLLWLHHGIKETEGILGEWNKHDDDWHPILIMDLSPSQIWFKKPKGRETYGECKLGGFGWAKVGGSVRGNVAIVEREERAGREKRWFWPNEIYNNTHLYTRATEIYSLGSILYLMMTGMPFPRLYSFSWRISRLSDSKLNYSKQLRDIVAECLSEKPAKRPNAMELVTKADEGWAGWRATTEEGARVVAVEDRELEMERDGGGMRLVDVL